MKSSTITLLLFFLAFKLGITDALAQDNQLLTKLHCKKGETRNFNYQSETKLWGPLQEKIMVTAAVEVDCMGRDKHSNALKYMVQLSQVRPQLIRDGESIKLDEKERAKIVRPKSTRSKRGTTSWLEDSWDKLKSFFIKLFRVQIERGMDNSDIEVEFDRRSCVPPVVVKESYSRSKRSTFDDQWFDETISLPFEFLQAPGGPVLEIRMNKRETNEAVKNFKKHIADTFATQLNGKKQDSFEESPIGEHYTHYAVSDDENNAADAINMAGIPLVKFLKNHKRKGKKMHIIRDIGRDDVVNVGSGSIVHDMDKVNITIRQIQEISDGKVTECAGSLFLDLITEDNEVGAEAEPSNMKRGRRTRDTSKSQQPMLNRFMKVQTFYTMTFGPARRRRAADQELRFEKLQTLEEDLVSETLVATSIPEQEDRRRLSQLQDVINRLAQSGGKLDLKHFVDGKGSPAYNALRDALLIESKLKLAERGERTISSAIRELLNRPTIGSLCGLDEKFDISKCYGILVIGLIAKSGDAIDVILSHINDKSEEVHSILSQHAYPDEHLVSRLIDHLEKSTKLSESSKGIHLMTISALAYRSKNPQIKRRITAMLSRELDLAQCNKFLTIDLLEAAGNLDGRDYMNQVVDLTRKCRKSEQVMVASIHALRHLLSEPLVQQHFTSLMVSPSVDCSIKREIILTLKEAENQFYRADKKSTNAVSNVAILFPQIVTFGQQIISNQDPKHTCLLSDLEELLKVDKSTSSRRSDLTNRRRETRALHQTFWDEADCKDFVDDNPSGPVISDKEKLLSKSVNSSLGYVHRRKCSATKTFGPRQLQAILKADIMNDILERGENPDYKLTANFALSSHVLGKDMDIGRMFLYQKRNASRAYVTVFGQTLLDSKSDSCETKSFEPYRYSAYVPLYDFTVWVVKVGLGLRLNGEMAFDHYKLACDKSSGKNTPEEVQIAPEASLRVAGEASGTVLILRGGIDIGGDFNYRSSLRFQPDPEFCITAHNGHKPMNVSVQPWFQFWDSSCDEWSMRNTFRPDTLSWSVLERSSSPWIDNECMSRKEPPK